MSAYYNDNDPYCAQWLRNLIAAGHLPAGEVDERPIQAVAADDLGRFGQCHFFAGIGGWALALRMARWGDEPVWTGSCPCQPFSAAGKRKGTSDERHLWPEFKRLIGQCKPATVLGEQVASKDGRLWLAGVRADLEALGYAVGGADLCAAGVGAPHIRQRLYWVADADVHRAQCDGRNNGEAAGISTGQRTEQRPALSQQSSATGGMAESASEQVGRAGQPRELSDGGVEHADGPQTARFGTECVPLEPEQEAGRPGHAGSWADFDLIGCADGKARRVESGTFPLASGIPNRMGRLRGYGNAIVPQVAAEFVAAFMECRP